MALLLLVEDHEPNRDMLRRRLARRGYVVETAEDGASAVELARALLPDLVLMDLSLPGVDGWEATRRLKADPTTRAIPVVALTAHAMSGAEAEARAAGCDGFVAKPIDFEALLGAIATLLAPGHADG